MRKIKMTLFLFLFCSILGFAQEKQYAVYGVAFYLCESGVNRNGLVSHESWNVIRL